MVFVAWGIETSPRAKPINPGSISMVNPRGGGVNRFAARTGRFLADPRLL
jgi:hypothetical protein